MADRPPLIKLFTFKDANLDRMVQMIVDYFNRPGLSLPVYSDNTAALAGGLTAGQEYRTPSGSRMVVY